MGLPAPTMTVIYYSATGTIHQLAVGLVEGAEKAGATVRLRRAAETAPEQAIDRNPEWRQQLVATDHIPTPSLDDLSWADAVVIGTPTRYGLPATPITTFFETTGPLWFTGQLADKVTGGFTSAGTAQGGKESTLLALHHVFAHWGAMIVPAGYVGETLKAAGNPYGVAAHAVFGGGGPSEDEVQAAGAYGARLAQLTATFVTGRDLGW